jgi:hypothetical protein
VAHLEPQLSHRRFSYEIEVQALELCQLRKPAEAILLAIELTIISFLGSLLRISVAQKKSQAASGSRGHQGVLHVI